MKKTSLLIAILTFLLTAWSNPASAQGGPENAPGEAVDKSIPDHVVLEKNQLPVLKTNAASLKTAKGAHVVLGLVDTTASSPRIHRKYTGMLISEGKISVCGIIVAAGSYGFGLSPKPPGEDYGKFTIYTNAGDEVGECAVKTDESMKASKSLAIITTKGGKTKLDLFKYAVDIE